MTKAQALLQHVQIDHNGERSYNPLIFGLLLVSFLTSLWCQYATAVVTGTIAVLVALWAYRRSLFGVLLRRVRLNPIVTQGDLLSVAEDGTQRFIDIELRPRIWHERVTEVDIRFVYDKGAERANHLPVPGSIIRVHGVDFEPYDDSRRNRGVIRSGVTANGTGMAYIFPDPLKLDRGRGALFRIWYVATRPFDGYLSLRTQTDDDAAMLLTRLRVKTTGESDV